MGVVTPVTSVTSVTPVLFGPQGSDWFNPRRPKGRNQDSDEPHTGERSRCQQQRWRIERGKAVQRVLKNPPGSGAQDES